MCTRKLFASDAVTLEFAFIAHQEYIALFEIAGCFGVPFVVAFRHTRLNHFRSNHDDAASGFTGSNCRAYIRCHIEQWLEFFHLLLRQIGQIVRFPKKLFNLILTGSVDVERAADQHLTVDNTNHHGPIIIIDATFRCLLCNDDGLAVGVVPDDTFEVAEILNQTKTDSDDLNLACSDCCVNGDGVF